MTLSIGIQITLWALGTVLTILVLWFGFVTSTKERITKLETKVDKSCREIESLDDLKERVAGVEKEQEIFMTVISPHLGRIIHSPNHKRRDELVDKLIASTITLPELEEVKVHLSDLAETTTNNDHRFAAALLLARTEILIDKENRRLAKSQSRDNCANG